MKHFKKLRDLFINKINKTHKVFFIDKPYRNHFLKHNNEDIISSLIKNWKKTDNKQTTHKYISSRCN